MLLRLAADRQCVVELGTNTAWTSCALLLADPTRSVTSFDPVTQPYRDAYVALLPAGARRRLRMVESTGAGGARHVAGPVDLLFVDCGHERQMVIDEVRAWQPRLADDALIVFDDYGHPQFPGVAEAIAELSLQGHEELGCFVARQPV